MTQADDSFTKGTVDAAMTREVLTVPKSATLADAVEALAGHVGSRAVYVVADQRPIGVVSYRTVLRAVNARLGTRASGPLNMVRYFRDLTAASVTDLMRAPHPVQGGTALANALEIMEEMRETDLPVVDADGKLVGELRGFDILALASAVVRAGDDAAAASRVEL